MKSFDLKYNPLLRRNISSRLLTTAAGLFAVISVLPLVLVIGFVIIKGGNKINTTLFTQIPPPPGLDGGGIGNAIIGTFIVTIIASLAAFPIGIGGGIFLSEYSNNGLFTKFIRFGTNILAAIPSIIAGVFIYGTIVSNRIILGSTFSAIAGGLALSILMIPTVIKTTDEALKLVSNDLRLAALGVGASKFTTIIRITLPTAFPSITTGAVLAIARAAGETAPLIFTALFSDYWSDGIFSPIATMSVLIYNFASTSEEVHIELAWSASFILIILILFLTLFSRWISKKYS